MRTLHDVVLRLRTLGITGETTFLSQAREVLASGEQLVDIGLVSGVPDEGIPRRIEDSVQRDSELNNPKVWSQMSARFSDFRNQELADLSGKLVELDGAQRVQVSWGGN